MKLLRTFPVLITGIVTTVSLTGASYAQTHLWGDGALPYEGRISEAWYYSPFSSNVAGNTLNAISWDGAAPGTRWHIRGMSIDAAGTQVRAMLAGRPAIGRW